MRRCEQCGKELSGSALNHVHYCSVECYRANSDDAWMERAKNVDTAKRNALIEAHRSLIRGLIRRWSARWPYARRNFDDLYQEAIIQLMRIYPSYDPARGPFGGFIAGALPFRLIVRWKYLGLVHGTNNSPFGNAIKDDDVLISLDELAEADANDQPIPKDLLTEITGILSVDGGYAGVDARRDVELLHTKALAVYAKHSKKHARRDVGWYFGYAAGGAIEPMAEKSGKTRQLVHMRIKDVGRVLERESKRWQ